MIDFEIVIPVYNEEGQLESSIRKLHLFLSDHFKNRKWRVTIADNASTDKTSAVGEHLSKTVSNINYFRVNQKGRGRALKKTWGESDAKIVAYMDVDLSTHIKHIPELIGSLEKDEFAVSIGSRLLPASRTTRSFRREIISRTYNLLIKLFHGTKFSDAQCGFKAVKTSVFRRLLPIIKNNEWFFDSELLIIAEKLGYEIYEIPVEWSEDMGSTVKIIPTAMEDLKGLWRLWWTKPWKDKI